MGKLELPSPLRGEGEGGGDLGDYFKVSVLGEGGIKD
jgi:hypothetical protein